jgi:hypothetical protein
VQDFEISPENKFIGNYMVIQKIETGEFKNRYLAEDMRSNKEVWIDEYFDKTQVNGESEEESRSIAALAQEVKKIHSSLIIYIHEVIENNNATYVIYDLPRGVRLKPLVKYDEKTVLVIGNYLVKALLSLQAHGVGVNNVPPEDIYLEPHKDIHLLFGDWISLRSNKSNSDEEIKCIGNILYFLILGETPNNLDEVEGKLKSHCSDLVSNIIMRMLSEEEGQKFQRLEQIIPLLEEKKRVLAEVLIVSDDTEVSVSHKIYRSLIILIAAIFLYSVMYQPKTLTLKEISVFDKARFHILGYIGVEEAQRALGEIYEKGYGVKQDYPESIEWYKKAAQKGNVYAQMSLGHLYDQGIGVAIDKKQALYWFTLAAANGDKVAKENVAIYTAPPTKTSVENTSGLNVQNIAEKKENLPIQDSAQLTNPVVQQPPTIENHTKYQEIDYNKFHSYWVDSSHITDVDGAQRYKGTIFGCGEQGFNNPVEIISLDHDVRSIAVDETRNIYWTDITTGEILKADPNGRNARAIVKGLVYPTALTIDNKNKKLYWNDWQNKSKPQKGYVGRSNLNGTGAEIFLSNGLQSGGTIKVDEREGKIYIVDLFGKKIVRVNLDGTNMVTIVYAGQPAGLDIDYDRRRIYWTDLSKDGIYASDYDGKNQQRIYTNGDTFSNPEALVYDRIRQKIFFAQNINYQDNIFSMDVSGNNLRNEYSQPHLYIRAIVQP